MLEKVPDNSMYEGDSKILTPGVAGRAIYNADVTYLNGTETHREDLADLQPVDVHLGVEFFKFLHGHAQAGSNA